MQANHNKLIVVLGPTASGKTDLAIELAQKYDGQIVSADSRAVYKYMNIGTAKPNHPGLSSFTEQAEQAKDFKDREIDHDKVLKVAGIPHYLIDIVYPDQEFSLSQYQALAIKTIQQIQAQGHLPFLVGGTGLYIKAVIDNLALPAVKPDQQLRQELNQKSLIELQELLKQKDALSYESIDINNPRRLIRALEVCLATGHSFIEQQSQNKPLFDVLQLGLSLPREEMYERINIRTDKQLSLGLVKETKKLLDMGYDLSLESMTGLGYRQVGQYLQGQIDYEEMVRILKRDNRHYAKRQMTWFKRNERIHWLKNYKQADELIAEFIQ